MTHFIAAAPWLVCSLNGSRSAAVRAAAARLALDCPRIAAAPERWLWWRPRRMGRGRMAVAEKQAGDKRAALGDLRTFIRESEATGELVRVPGADPELELGALYELSNEHRQPPVLLFETIKGCDP